MRGLDSPIDVGDRWGARRLPPGRTPPSRCAVINNLKSFAIYVLLPVSVLAAAPRLPARNLPVEGFRSADYGSNSVCSAGQSFGLNNGWTVTRGTVVQIHGNAYWQPRRMGTIRWIGMATARCRHTSARAGAARCPQGEKSRPRQGRRTGRPAAGLGSHLGRAIPLSTNRNRRGHPGNPPHHEQCPPGQAEGDVLAISRAANYDGHK